MDKIQAEDILLQAINEAYPIWSSTGFIPEHDEAIKALNYLLGRCKDD